MSVWRLWNQSWNIVATASSDEWIRWTSCLFSSIRPTAAFKRVWKMETKSYVSDRNRCDWRGTVSRPPNAPDPSLWEDQGISHELQSVSYLPSFNLISTFPRSCCCIHDETPQGKWMWSTKVECSLCTMRSHPFWWVHAWSRRGHSMFRAFLQRGTYGTYPRPWAHAHVWPL